MNPGTVRNMLLRGLACVLLLAAVVVLVLRGVPVHTSLYDLLPSGGGAATQSLDRMARASSRQVNVLIKGDSEQNALAQAQRILENLPSGVTPLTNQNMLAKVAESLHPYRFQLLSTRHRAALSAGDDEALREEALTNLYSFVPLSLYPADVDPYGFVTAFLMENPLVRQNGLEPRDGVLMGMRDGVHYAYLPLMLPESAADSLDELQAIMSQLHELCSCEGILLAGTPVHTWRASTSSQSAMTVLSIVSSVMVVCLFLWVFSSLRGVLFMVLTLTASGIMALGVSVLVFGEVHILALVFGCSLVGISTDYVVHYLVDHHNSDDAGLSPPLKKSLLFGLLTSVLGYASFYAAGVELLGQIATLSISGLGSAMLLIFAFYPLLFRRHLPVRLSKGAVALGNRIATWRIHPMLPWGVAALMLLVAVLRLPVSDDLRSFYRPEADLLAAEKEMATLNGMEHGMLTLVVRGAQAEEILQRQELLGALLQQAGVDHFTSVASLIPSAARQKADLEAVRQLVGKYQDEVPVEMPQTWPGALLPGALLEADSPFASLCSLWEPGAGLVLVPGEFRSAVETLPAFSWLEKADRFADLQGQIQSWREQLMLLLVLVGVVVLLLLSLHFGPRHALCMCGPVLAGILTVFGGLAMLGIPLTLFHVLACYLVLGLGCDYAIFRAVNDRANPLTAMAVFLSFLTSWAMFGVLAFTRFSVTQDMGVAICLGLTVAYVLSPAARGAAAQRCTASCEPMK